MTLQIEPVVTDSLRQQMRDYADEFGMFEKCPLVKALDVVRRKWAIQIVLALYRSNAPVRFNQLERELAPITQKELTKRLRELEQTGIVTRTIYPEVPPRVEYALTESGQAFKEALGVLGAWSRKYNGEPTA
jgi:DNA-binding HxlR family transcriptional regulator